MAAVSWFYFGWWFIQLFTFCCLISGQISMQRKSGLLQSLQRLPHCLSQRQTILQVFRWMHGGFVYPESGRSFVCAWSRTSFDMVDGSLPIIRPISAKLLFSVSPFSISTRCSKVKCFWLPLFFINISNLHRQAISCKYIIQRNNSSNQYGKYVCRSNFDLYGIYSYILEFKNAF